MSIAIDRNVGRRIKDLADRLGMTLYSLTNQMLTQAITVFEESDATVNLHDLWVTYKVHRDLNLLPIGSENLVNYVTKLYRCDRELTIESWKRWGRELALYLKREYPTLKRVSEVITNILPYYRVFKYVEMAGEVHLQVSLADPVTEEVLQAQLASLREFIDGYGYRVKKEEVQRGTIDLELQKR